jgi:hypothetical protein
MNGSSIQLFIANKNCKKRQHTVILQWYCFTLAFFAFVSVNFTSTSPSLWCAAKLLISQMGSPESCKIIRALYNYMRIFFLYIRSRFYRTGSGRTKPNKQSTNNNYYYYVGVVAGRSAQLLVQLCKIPCTKMCFCINKLP